VLTVGARPPVQIKPLAARVEGAARVDDEPQRHFGLPLHL
jgi:hypothetical protein